MDYIELTLDAADAEQAEILTAELADFPFESFEQEGARLKAYIPQERLADCKGEVDALLAHYGVGRATFLSIEPQNWNALWESNFTPVEVDGRLTIRAPFHAPAATEAEVVIMPKMSFGTGHHATTCLMASGLLDRDVTGLRGLDMGSGTGVLAIVAALRGAEIGAEIVIKATKVDGIYTADPKKDPTATMFDEITFDDALRSNLMVMDATAFALCREQGLPIKVFNINKKGALRRVILGEQEGTLVHS